MKPDDFHILDPAVIENPYPFYQALLEHAPVYRVPGTQVYLVSSWHLIREVLANERDYSANLTGILIRGQDGDPELFDFSHFGGTVDALANADEPVHAVHRKLVLPQLNARRVAAMEGDVRQWARDAVAQLTAAGGGDCVAVLANPIPVKVMARLAGLPVTDVDQLLRWAFAGGDILAGTGTLERMIELGESTGELAVYLRAHVAQAQEQVFHEPGNVIQELVLGMRQGLISEDEAIAILIVLVGAAGESTSSLVGSAIRLLAADADLQAQLRERPELIEAFVEEVVRLQSPFKGHYRVVRAETRLGGQVIPPQARVFLLWAAANRDSAVFARAHALDLARTDGREHLGFGRGIHFCIGARLARLEARVILQELLAGSAKFALDPVDSPCHVASIFVRRLSRLPIQVFPA